jgi:sigma-B regulation protein RsbU (phosphoserine phosphatase)
MPASTGPKLGIVIGDVSGKAVSGALVMAACRSIFRVLAESDDPVATLMTTANERLHRDIKRGMFVAVLYAVLDPQTKRLTLSNAGQPQPILVTTAGPPAHVETDGDSFPLGIVPEARYEPTTLSLASGETIVLYSDGVVEAMNAKGEMYGFERLMTTVDQRRALNAESLLEAILADVGEHAKSVEQHDDITLVVVKGS